MPICTRRLIVIKAHHRHTHPSNRDPTARWVWCLRLQHKCHQHNMVAPLNHSRVSTPKRLCVQGAKERLLWKCSRVVFPQQSREWQAILTLINLFGCSPALPTTLPRLKGPRMATLQMREGEVVELHRPDKGGREVIAILYATSKTVHWKKGSWDKANGTENCAFRFMPRRLGTYASPSPAWC